MQISPNYFEYANEQHKIEQEFEVVKTKIMKYGNLIMRIFGFYHHKSDKLILKVYPIIALTIIWFDTIKSLWCFNVLNNESETISAEFALKVSMVLWVFSCSISITII